MSNDQNTNRNLIYTSIVVLVGVALFAWLLLTETHHHDHSDGHHDGHAEDETAKGPHGGNLLQQDGFALEMKIFEQGVSPEFHIYAYYDGKILKPDDVDLNIKLQRLDGQVDDFQFQAQNDYLRGDGEVTEPHSFDVLVKASYQGQQYTWQYANYEGRVQIAKDIAQQSGVKTAAAGSQKIKEILDLTGRVTSDPNRVSQVRARFPGVVTKVQTELGKKVRKGDVLAEIQSNESLQTYVVEAPISGVIVLRNIQVGEATGEEALFTLADFSKVWVELDVFAKDLARVKVGQSVQIASLGGESVSGKINWLSPMAAHASQSIQARVVLNNKLFNGTRRFKPGQFVRGRITLAEHAVPLAVRQSGVQGFRDFQVVFARFDDTYEVRMLELGRKDRTWVEVLGGLKPGTEYVTENSYLIKADIEKSGASHDH